MGDGIRNRNDDETVCAVRENSRLPHDRAPHHTGKITDHLQPVFRGETCGRGDDRHRRASGLEVGHFFSLLKGWRNCPGCVVTIPHKQEAARQADELSPRARDLGAVNVIRRTDQGRLIGDMVDGIGFLEALKLHGFDVEGKRVVVFGAGGAGSAIAYSAAESNAAEIVVIDKDRARQQDLLNLISSRYPSVVLSDRIASLAGFHLAVNATPLGMNGDPNVPFPLDTLESHTLVADVVTEPEITPWLAGAKARGCPVQTGYEMTLGQFTIMGRHMGIVFDKTERSAD